MNAFSKTALVLALALGSAPVFAAGAATGLAPTPSGPVMHKINYLCTGLQYCMALRDKCGQNGGLWTTEAHNTYGKPIKGVCRM